MGAMVVGQKLNNEHMPYGMNGGEWKQNFDMKDGDVGEALQKTMLQNQGNTNRDKKDRIKEEGSKLEAESEFEGGEMKK